MVVTSLHEPPPPLFVVDDTAVVVECVGVVADVPDVGVVAPPVQTTEG